jgi:hypothetical protein
LSRGPVLRRGHGRLAHNGLLWPGQQRLVTAAFLLNPLLVYEGIAALHNDLWGMTLLLWACYYFVRADGHCVLPLGLSILTKYAALFAAPFLGVYYLRRREWSRLGWLVGALLITLALLQVTVAENLVTLFKEGRSSDILSVPVGCARLINLFHPALDFPALVTRTNRVLTALFVSSIWLCSRARAPAGRCCFTAWPPLVPTSWSCSPG